jgi:neutral ceramidase
VSVHAGFAETDITPPIGTRKIGWIIRIISDEVLDPLYARAAVFADGSARIGFVQLDTLSIRWTTTADIRRRIQERYGFPGEHIMVSATHNHAGPAVSGANGYRDEEYVETLVEKVVATFGQALDSMESAEIGIGRTVEFDLTTNRRLIMRGGTAKTHGTFDDPDALCFEGPIDPELAVIAARSPANGAVLGVLVNFACHPTHHGGETTLSAGFPGCLAAELKRQGIPVTMYLNGACGNIHFSDPTGQRPPLSKEQLGTALAGDVTQALDGLDYMDDMPLGAASTTVQLPYRQPTEDDIKGTARGAQRFVDPSVYDRQMPALLERIKTRGTQPAEVQTLFMGDHALAAIPAEYFVQNGLRIKEEAAPTHALVVSCANGMVGYVPHAEAFKRGGYETTFGMGTRLAPEAGDILADAAIDLIKQGAVK